MGRLLTGQIEGCVLVFYLDFGSLFMNSLFLGQGFATKSINCKYISGYYLVIFYSS